MRRKPDAADLAFGRLLLCFEHGRLARVGLHFAAAARRQRRVRNLLRACIENLIPACSNHVANSAHQPNLRFRMIALPLMLFALVYFLVLRPAQIRR